MNFDNLQSAWDNDKNTNVEVPKNLDKLKSANMPLEKIKRNLRIEFVLHIIAIAFLGLLPALNFIDVQYSMLFYALFSGLMATCIYYFFKFFKFYKRLVSMNLNTKDNLYETYFDIKLNMEIYKTFNFVILPLALGLIFLEFISLTKIPLQNIDHGLTSKPYFMIILAFGIVSQLLIIGLLTEWWVHFFYGKYAKQIKKVIDELRGE